jgi:putative ABC transport system permease protein
MSAEGAGVRTYAWLAWQSVRNRRLASFVTVLTIALSVALLVGVSTVQRSARESFTGVISQTDLIVGPPGGSTQLLLYTVFHLGAPIANVEYEDYERVAAHPAVAWTIPLSLGDSHRGYRVVATTSDFYSHYRHHGDEAIGLHAGRFPEALWDVALGSDAARALGYDLGSPVVVTHGLAGGGIADHDEKPFTLVGILEPTGTPIDQSVFLTLTGFEAMHIDWHEGAPPRPGEAMARDAIRAQDVAIDEITAFLMGTSSRIEALGLQREINTDEDLALMAILPGVTLSELWQVVGYAEQALLLVAALVVVVGLLGMTMTIYVSLEARRRELAILRALGAGVRGITGLLLLEAAFLSAAGAGVGLALFYVVLFAMRPLVRRELGLALAAHPPGALELAFLAAVILLGTAMAIPPALKAYRRALGDGLTVRS